MSYSRSKAYFENALTEIRESGLFKDERLIHSPQSGKVSVEFPEGAIEREVINLCSNNYLGLSSHPEVIRAAHEGLDARGFGMSSVRFICGTQDIHRKLEKKMSSFLETEDTILFPSCFDANAALFEALLIKEDEIFSDQLIHASLIDGIRLSKAARNVYAHSDMSDLRQKLSQSEARIKVIVTDGVFSMDGDMGKIDELVQLAEEFEALLVVDDCHATGFIGENGKGTQEHFDVMGKVDIITTTFGKALGGATGGSISGPKEVISLLKQRARPYLFSNALAPSVVAASLKVLDVVQRDSERREVLEENTKFWRSELENAGFELKSGNTPIVPVMLHEAKLAQSFSRDLFEKGVFAVGFFYPVVAKGQARIRTQMSAGLKKQDLERALECFIEVGRNHKVI